MTGLMLDSFSGQHRTMHNVQVSVQLYQRLESNPATYHAALEPTVPRSCVNMMSNSHLSIQTETFILQKYRWNHMVCNGLCKLAYLFFMNNKETISHTKFIWHIRRMCSLLITFLGKYPSLSQAHVPTLVLISILPFTVLQLHLGI